MENDLINYLGDGVYAQFDGYNIHLLANDHKNPTDRICLEPSVLKALDNFKNRCKTFINNINFITKSNLKPSKLKDGSTKPFEIGCKVIYIPDHLLSSNHHDIIINSNLGYVSSKNDKFVFVKFKKALTSKEEILNTTANACKPEDLYFLDNRPDLANILE